MHDMIHSRQKQRILLPRPGKERVMMMSLQLLILQRCCLWTRAVLQSSAIPLKLHNELLTIFKFTAHHETLGSLLPFVSVTRTYACMQSG